MSISPVHSCKIHCHTIDPSKLDNIVSCKLASDDEELLVCNCTTVFTTDGDTYIIDTLFEDFEPKFRNYFEEMAGYNPLPAEL